MKEKRKGKMKGLMSIKGTFFHRSERNCFRFENRKILQEGKKGKKRKRE